MSHIAFAHIDFVSFVHLVQSMAHHLVHAMGIAGGASSGK